MFEDWERLGEGKLLHPQSQSLRSMRANQKTVVDKFKSNQSTRRIRWYDNQVDCSLSCRSISMNSNTVLVNFLGPKFCNTELCKWLFDRKEGWLVHIGSPECQLYCCPQLTVLLVSKLIFVSSVTSRRNNSYATYSQGAFGDRWTV